MLLEAIAMLKAQGYAARLRFVGDGPDREWLKSRVADLGIDALVEFTGWVDQNRLMALYADTKIIGIYVFYNFNNTGRRKA